jgi:hypothetical protein
MKKRKMLLQQLKRRELDGSKRFRLWCVTMRRNLWEDGLTISMARRNSSDESVLFKHMEVVK